MEVIHVDWDALPFELGYEPLKKYLRVFDNGENSEHGETVDLLVKSAVFAAQNYTRQAIVKTQYRSLFNNLPAILSRFPIVSIDSLEARVNKQFQNISVGQQLPFESELTEWQSGSWNYFIKDDVQPPKLIGSAIPGATGYQVTWSAGYAADKWPKDLILLVAQAVEENFDNRGSTPGTAQAIRFSRSHELVLEQYVTHHDSLRWA